MRPEKATKSPPGAIETGPEANSIARAVVTSWSNDGQEQNANADNVIRQAFDRKMVLLWQGHHKGICCAQENQLSGVTPHPNTTEL